MNGEKENHQRLSRRARGLPVQGLHSEVKLYDLNKNETVWTGTVRTTSVG
jgi:hypothetical protein